MICNTQQRVLIANRGEIAARILRAVETLGWEAVAVRASDEQPGPYFTRAHANSTLPGSGVQAYLDGDALIEAARNTGATMVHPGYGFLSESAEFARACADAGLTFIGPSPEALKLLGDKVSARELAHTLQVPTPAAADSIDDARTLLNTGARAIMLKAAGGGGGRGMRVVTDQTQLDDAWSRAAAEAERAFGNSRIYAEELLTDARHIEVQMLGDGRHSVALGDRDCSLQRRRQKVLEFAPAVTIPKPTREALARAATALCEAAQLRGAATVEFLVTNERWTFMEVNPRIQVEHPVTEEVTGVDLVGAQLLLATGEYLDALGLTEPPLTRGLAIESRITAETFSPAGAPEAATGRIMALNWPNGAGVRIESGVQEGDLITGAYDPLLAKLVTRTSSPDLATALRTHRLTLEACHIDGVDTTLPFLTALAGHEQVLRTQATTTFVDDHLSELLDASGNVLGRAGNCETLDSRDLSDSSPQGNEVRASTVGTVLEVRAAVGDEVRRGQEIILLEAMKMEHALIAPCDGRVVSVDAETGAAVQPGQRLLSIERSPEQSTQIQDENSVDLDAEREDLAALRAAHEPTLDEARPEAVAKRHATDHRTARENIADLVDADSFREYGALAVAAQRRRRGVEELVAISPADGIVTGLGRINSEIADNPVCAVLAYDYTVMAGTQGVLNHKKTDRLLEVARERSLPVVLFAEGGGGRPGDTDTTAVAGLDLSTFSTMGALRGHVPSIGIASGRCFAGNAALLGACDIVIATRDANLGMGGPAMIEGGGLGTFSPWEIGPAPEQYRIGVVDVLVEDEAAAVTKAKKILALLQQPHAPASDVTSVDQRLLRHCIPLNRRRAYDVGQLIETLIDAGTFEELRGGYADAALTGLARINGRTIGLIANDPQHGGGAIDADAARKFADFLSLCERHSVPVVSLCDTPGFMVGPESERRGTVRLFPQLFVAGAQLTVPMVTIVTRKGYGLGAMAMAGGSFANPVSTIAWPTGEIGAMGLEGAVRLGYRRELEAIADPQERNARYEAMVAAAYEAGKATNAARAVEIDAVIDPAETRAWITTAFEGA